MLSLWEFFWDWTGIPVEPTVPADELWGVPRQISGQHPVAGFGSVRYSQFGLPRRVYQDGLNTRVEHWRQGNSLEQPEDVCELPTRYAQYLRHFALHRALTRPGPGQDLKLSAHYGERWQRDLARIARRTHHVETQRLLVLGSGPRRSTTQPPPYQWPFGSPVR